MSKRAGLLCLLVLVPVAALAWRRANPPPRRPLLHLLAGKRQQQSRGPGTIERTVTVGGVRRSYLVHVPPSYDGGKPAPVVLNFHGGGGNAEAQEDLTGMDAKSDSAGYLAVYPQGSGRLKTRFLSFNAGLCCGYARDQNVDDVRFVSALLDDLQKQYRVDPKRIYATGHSNGAMMCHRLACELSDRIAAIAPVAGSMGIDACRPGRPVPVLHFHGTADECAPYNGGKAKVPGAGLFPSVKSTIEGWAKRDGCSAQPREILRRGNAVCRTYPGCTGSSEVTLCTIEGGGHAWPGSKSYPSKGICGGELSHDISASDMMWDFFQRHPLDGSWAGDGAGR